MRPVELIGVASGIGAQDQGCADGPGALRHLHAFLGGQPQAEWDGMLRPVADKRPVVEVDAELCTRLAERVRLTLARGRFPLVVGGDHSCAIGTWSGVYRWLDGRGPLGLIWLDAHMDSHTFATTPSGALHGMPLACLLGHGEPALTSILEILPKLRPEHICLLGVRSYEAGEAALLRRLGVRVISMDEVRERGLAATLDEAISIARNGTAGFGVSLDLDVLDPTEDPGVGSPAPGGIRCHELEQALHRLRGDPALLAMEIVEYNPHRDRDCLTARAADALFRAVLSAAG
jgi:arginase